MNAREIGDALDLKFSQTHICFTEVKDGSTWMRSGHRRSGHRRVDFLAIKKTWSPVNILICETKISRSDFTGDDKWPEYMKLCNRFYWACPAGLIKKEEVDPKCGLIYVNPKTKVASVRKAAPFRENEPDAHLLLYLILWRLGEAKNVNKVRDRKERERDMETGKEFGKTYALFHDQKLTEANQRVAIAEAKAELAEKQLATVKDASDVLGRLEREGVDLLALGTRGLLENVWKLRQLVSVDERMVKLRDDINDILVAIGNNERGSQNEQRR